MNSSADTRQVLQFWLGSDGSLVFQGPRNSRFERRAQLLGGHFDAQAERWTFPRAASFQGMDAVVRTAIAVSYPAPAVSPLFDPANAFASWSDAFDEAVESGYLDQMLHPAHAVC